MKRATIAAWFGLLFAFAMEATAVERCFPADRRLAEVNSITALPTEVGAALGATKSGLDGIADNGQSFNSTDDVDTTLPMRRFSIAGVSKNCVLVAVERGGRGYSVEVSMFELNSNVWHRKALGVLTSPPVSLSDLFTRANEFHR